MWNNSRSISLAVLLVPLISTSAAAASPHAGAQPHAMQQRQQQPEKGSKSGLAANPLVAFTAAELLLSHELQHNIAEHSRALAQSPEPWPDQDWVNKQIQAITNMIISIRESAAPSSSNGPLFSGTALQYPQVAPLPTAAAAAAESKNADDRNGPFNADHSGGLNATSPQVDRNSSSAGLLGVLGQPGGNMSSSAGDVNVLSMSLLPGAASKLPGTHGNNSGDNNSRNGPSPVAASGADSTAGSPRAAPYSASAETPGNNSMQSYSKINISATTAAAAAAAAVPAPPPSSTAATVAVTAVQLMSLLSSLQPSNTTSPFTKVDYGYNVFNTSGNMPLAVPVINIPDPPVSRWVLAAWSISNHSSTPLALEEGDAQDRRAMLLGNFTQLQPQQVQVAVTANVTLSLLFIGVEWKRPASKALQQAASDAAGGYTQAFVQVAPVQPEYGVNAADFINQDVQYSGDGVSDKAVTLSYLPAPDISSSSSGARHRFSRKLLQQQQQQQQSAGQPAAAVVVEPMMTRVWVQYQRVDASNVTALMAALAAAFSNPQPHSANRTTQQQWQQQPPVWEASVYPNLTGTVFGAYTRKLLQSRGAQVDNSSYAVFLNKPPMTTTNIRIAAAVTDSQTSPTASRSTDQLVALWLANASNIIGPTHRSAAPVGASALVSWLLTPEVWTQPQVQPLPAVPTLSSTPQPQPTAGSSGLSPGATAGVAVVGAVAAAALLVGVFIHQADRWRKQRTEDKAESSAGSQRRRRRHHAKPRYLLPGPPQLPSPPGSSSSAAAAGVDAVCDGNLSPDQLRAELRELGDSVTSAARFELHEQRSEGLEAAAESGSSAAPPVIEIRFVDGQTAAPVTAAAAASSSDCQGPNRLPDTPATAQEQQAEDSAGRSTMVADVPTLSDTGSDADIGSCSMPVACGGGCKPGNSWSQWPDTARPTAPPDVSPTTASLALTGASITPRPPPPIAAAAAAMPCQPAGQLLTGPWAVVQPNPGMQTPFANYAFAETAQPAAAIAAITAAYTKDRHKNLSRGSSSSSSSSKSKQQINWCTAGSRCGARDLHALEDSGSSPNPTRGMSDLAATATAAAGVAEPDALWMSSIETDSAVLVPPTPQPTSEAIRLPSVSPQRKAQTLPTLPAASTSAAPAGMPPDESFVTNSAASSPSATSVMLCTDASTSGGTVGIPLQLDAHRSSPFARSYNLSLLADSAPFVDSAAATATTGTAEHAVAHCLPVGLQG